MRLLTFVFVAAMAVLVVSDAAAANGTLKNISHTVAWSGTVHRTDPPSGEIPECAANACRRFDLHVQSPNGVWNQKP